MVSDAALDLSLDQLIVVLDKKLFLECTRMQIVMPPVSHALVTTLTAEVRSRAVSKRGSDAHNVFYRSTLWRNERGTF